MAKEISEELGNKIDAVNASVGALHSWMIRQAMNQREVSAELRLLIDSANGTVGELIAEATGWNSEDPFARADATREYEDTMRSR